jgi:hypothetical protein
MKSLGIIGVVALSLLAGCKSNPSTTTASTNYTQAAVQAGGTLNSDGTVTNLNGSITKPDGTVVPAPTSNTSDSSSPTPSQPLAGPPPPTPAPVVRVLTAPAGTNITIRTNEEISSKLNHEGDAFTATLVNPITVHGQTLYPAGTPVGGQVISTKNKGEFKGAGDISLILTSIGHQHVSTTQYDQVDKGRGKRTGAMIGGGAAAGAILGGIFGGGKGAAIGGAAGAGAGTAGSTTGSKDVLIRPESIITFQLTEPLAARH